MDNAKKFFWDEIVGHVHDGFQCYPHARRNCNCPEPLDEWTCNPYWVPEFCPHEEEL